MDLIGKKKLMTKELNSMVAHRRLLLSKLEKVKDKKRDYVGNFCLICNSKISKRSVSKKCTTCYETERNKERCLQRTIIRNDNQLTIFTLKKN